MSPGIRTRQRSRGERSWRSTPRWACGCVLRASQSAASTHRTTGTWSTRRTRPPESGSASTSWSATSSRTLAFAAGLLKDAEYLGAVDVGVGLTQVARTLSPLVYGPGVIGRRVPAWAGHVDEEYRRADQVSSTRLTDHPDEIARDLLEDLFDALAQGDYPSGQHPIGPRP